MWTSLLLLLVSSSPAASAEVCVAGADGCILNTLFERNDFCSRTAASEFLSLADGLCHQVEIKGVKQPNNFYQLACSGKGVMGKMDCTDATCSDCGGAANKDVDFALDKCEFLSSSSISTRLSGTCPPVQPVCVNGTARCISNAVYEPYVNGDQSKQVFQSERCVTVDFEFLTLADGMCRQVEINGLKQRGNFYKLACGDTSWSGMTGKSRCDDDTCSVCAVDHDKQEVTTECMLQTWGGDDNKNLKNQNLKLSGMCAAPKTSDAQSLHVSLVVSALMILLCIFSYQ